MTEQFHSAAPSSNTSKEEVNGHQHVGISRQMLCGGDHVRSLVCDAARYLCILKEQWPPQPCAATKQNYIRVVISCHARLTQACTPE